MSEPKEITFHDKQQRLDFETLLRTDRIGSDLAYIKKNNIKIYEHAIKQIANGKFI